LDEPALTAVLGAERLASGVLLVERRLPLRNFQGRFAPAACVAALPELLETAPGDPEGWLFLDTETSGLAGGTGTWVFLTGVARIDGGDLLLRQYLLTRLDAEPDYLAAIQSALDRCDLLVSYNGKSFDVPLLTTRLRLASMTCPLDALPHLDLLHLVRRAYRRVWPDCRLATVERCLLGLGREQDLPGSEAPLAWLAWLRRGESPPLAGVLDHNRRDLLSLPALVTALERTYREPANVGADVRSVARHRLLRGDETMALSLLAGHRSRLDSAGLLELARLHRRRGQWEAAVTIWERLSERGEPAALEALAKHLEHRIGDHSRALDLARRLPPGDERDRRCRRLELRLGIAD
jgi:uncharacterized protein YprB with RNaseH-like and TPR domain